MHGTAQLLIDALRDGCFARVKRSTKKLDGRNVMIVLQSQWYKGTVYIIVHNYSILKAEFVIKLQPVMPAFEKYIEK